MNHLFRKYNLTLIALLLGLIVLLGSNGGTAAIQAADPILVACTDGVGDVAALIAAVEEANNDPDKDTIRLGENCTYTLVAPFPGNTTHGLVLIENDEVVLQGNGATIERDGQAPPFRLLYVEANVRLTANNLTLRGGSLPTEGGGAIYTNPGGSLTLSRVNIEYNEAKEGGAIYTQSATIISNSHVWDNWTEDAAGKGGAIYATAALTVENSDLYWNYGEGGGGAIYAVGETAVYASRLTGNGSDKNNGGAILADGTLRVTGSHFAYNYAFNGGGINGNNVQITDSIFYGNYAQEYGGGVFAMNASRGIHGVHFAQNSAEKAAGGGMYVFGDLDLQRSYFYRNESGQNGGGLYLYNSGPTALIANNLWVDNASAVQVGNAMGLAVASSGTNPFHVRHNTVVHTGSVQPGSGIFISNSYAIFVNNILTGFETAIRDQSAKAYTVNNLYYNNEINEQGLDGSPENALVADPQFAGVGNYRLSEGSPAIDSAANLQPGTTTDILGTPRPQGNANDRGAYEFNGEAEKVYPVACVGGVGDVGALFTAITAANQHFGPDVIEIEGEDCVFELTTAAGEFGAFSPSGLPAVMDTLWLEGNGATLQRAESAAPFRLLENYAPKLTVEDLTIRNGYAEAESGGAIYSADETELHLLGVKLLDNQADETGGGVSAIGRLTVEYSEVIGNRASGRGGGLYSNGGLTISNSVVSGNESGESGGGANGWDGRIANTLFTDNQASEYGGGLWVGGGIELRSSTFVNNRAAINGGGLQLSDPYRETTVENSVWINNEAAGRGAALSIRDYYSQVYHIRHNTFAGDATPESVAVYLVPFGTTTPAFNVVNNIITGHAVGVMRENKGTLTTAANLYFDNGLNEVGATASNFHVKADPRFRHLAGGDVRLRAGSPAIDNATNLNVPVDRNNVARPQGDGIDIGAYEYVENVPPTAAPDSYTTLQDTPLEIPAPGVLGNDEDPNNEPLAAVLASQPAHGTLTLNANGSFSYTPEAGYSGSDSFTYRADDYADQTEPVTVTITVLPTGTNIPPTAAADAYSTRQDKPLEIPAPGVLDNDEDTNGDALTAVLQAPPVNGSLTLNNDGSFSYAPKAGFTGSDSFSYQAHDGKASSAETVVTITVLADGANLPPVAFGDGYETSRGRTLTIAAPGVLGNDQDGDGDALAAVVESQPAHGTVEMKADGSFTYLPDSGFSGTDRFTYRASDGRARSAATTVTIVVRSGGGQIQRRLLPIVFKP